MTYRYIFADRLTGTVLEELPLECDSASRILNGVGRLEGSLTLTDLGALDWRAATEERRTAVYVERDERVIVWGGILWKRRATDNGDRVQISCETFESWLARRRVQVGDPLNWTDDAFNHIRLIMDWMEFYGYTGITVQQHLSGQSATVTWYDRDRREILKTIQDLAEAEPGFEFTIDASRDANGLFTRTLQLAAPRFAQTIDPIVLELPGNIIDYTYDEDGSAAPNEVYGIGATENDVTLTYKATDTADLAAGFPLDQAEWSDTNEKNAGQLQKRTKEVLAAGLAERASASVVLDAAEEPTFGSYPLGVSARLRITSPYHPATATGAPGLEVTKRVTGWTLRPGRAGQKDTVELLLGRS